jgi:hypothetical protein
MTLLAPRFGRPCTLTRSLRIIMDFDNLHQRGSHDVTSLFSLGKIIGAAASLSFEAKSTKSHLKDSSRELATIVYTMKLSKCSRYQ